uniref:Uncharacterized protein n=1 Tax=Anguilla anguilla TaxID=7936 RepID=A0A0E9W532_ANGAN
MRSYSCINPLLTFYVLLMVKMSGVASTCYYL